MLQVLFLSFLLFIILNVPIGVGLGLAGIAAFAAQGDIDLIIVVQRMFRAMDSTTLLAIPLFIFAGKIMERGGISKRLVDFSYSMFGWMHGSLAIVTVVGCMFFAAVSGSAPATVIALGTVMAPRMIDDGYPAAFAVALPAAAGCIGVIIPPSIPFVNYAVITGVSIADMFVAGFLPGILMGFVLILYSYFMARKYKWGGELKPFEFKKFINSLKSSILALLFPVIILGGIYAGFFTPTEAAAAACAYGILVASIVYKEFKISELPKVAYEGARTTGMIFLIMGTAAIFSWILSTQQVPRAFSTFVLSITDSPFIILLLINIVLLINGCFMELTASTFIYVPILFPLSQAIGIDPIQFGVMLLLNMTLGLLTPPLGINLFIAEGLDDRADFNGIIKAVLPMFGLLVALLMAITYIPALTVGILNLFR